MHVIPKRASAVATASPDPSSGVAAGRRAGDAPGSTAPASRDGESRINVLIVDDEPKNLTVLETILDDPRYRLVRAESADEALLALVAQQFALLILDIRMPGMTGFELAQVIRQRKKTASVPIIFLTAYYNEDQHVLEGYDVGAVDYLMKPVNPHVLRSKVAIFAELHRRSLAEAHANDALTVEVAQRRRAEEQLHEVNETLEQRVAERTEELRKANRLKDEFLAMLSHELRNPLSAITNAVEFIGAGGVTPDRAAWAMTLIKRQTGHLRRVVDDLLDVARITRGKIELRKEPVDLVDVVHRAVDAVRPFVASDDELEVVISGGAPLRVNADLTRLEQVVVNLLLNAIKFSSERRRVRLAIERGDGNAVVSISDNGIGIAPEILPHIFDLFIQEDRSIDRVQGGLGIGLFICRQLLELHEGSIAAHSEGVGRGASFTIRLPLVPAVAEAAPAGLGANERTAGQGTKLVLIADDNVDSAMALALLLGRRGHEVRVAHDGTAALAAANEWKPDVFLLDLGLPGIDGYGLARRLRTGGFASARIIAISGYARDSDVKASLDAGFDRHFAKPVPFAELVETLESQEG
jgi:signal transduction histidine kinase